MPADAGVTATAATGTVVTAIAAVPLCPSLVAERVAEPGAMPVTSPLPLTVATDGFELDQLTARPESVLPLASLSVAASCHDPGQPDAAARRPDAGGEGATGGERVQRTA